MHIYLRGKIFFFEQTKMVHNKIVEVE